MTDPAYDAVVVGAGPAGSVAARELARRGLAVLLVDKATFPRPKVCGGCLNAAALAAFDRAGLGHVPAACGAVPLRGVKLAAGRRSANLPLPGGVAVSREAFDAALLREAEAAGVEVVTGVTAKVEDARTGLATAGPPAPGSRLGGGVVVPADLAPDFFTPGTIFMATGRGGYVGLVRVEGGRLDVAAAFDPDFVKAAGGLGPAAEAILTRTGWPATPGLAELPWKGTPALTRHPTAVAGHRLFAVGDAAGYVEPFTGEGMAWAVASAAAVAPIAARAVTAWDGSLAREWEQTHARLVRHRQGVCRAAARVVRSPALTGLAVRALSMVPVLSRPVVAALNRPPAVPTGPAA
ncbi:MAG: FAD-dependent monooxygenase [Gemmataceae bacterium]|nr:FAD-dependent monooxygenase [Gemmataceae bacterium]